MLRKKLRAAIRRGDRVYGTVIVSDSPKWPGIVAKIGLDFVFIDTEHIAIDRKTLSWMCQAYTNLGMAAIVRISAPDPYLATMVLDGGADGVIAPYVETVEEVKALVGAVKHRPIKGARLAGVLDGKTQFEPALKAYQAANHSDHLLIINTESLPAIANLDNLLAVEGVDSVLIGPHDLSSSLGDPENYDTPEFEAAVRTIFHKARAHGVGAGIHSWLGLEREITWAREAGLNFIVHSADAIAMRESLSSDIAALRQALGDKDCRQEQPGRSMAENI